MNLLASTLTNGALANLANLREISVLPTPVGPISIILLGTISFRIVPSICCRRQRFRNAIATALLALD